MKHFEKKIISFFFKNILFQKSTHKVQTFRVANCATIAKVKEKVIKVSHSNGSALIGD